MRSVPRDDATTDIGRIHMEADGTLVLEVPRSGYGPEGEQLGVLQTRHAPGSAVHRELLDHVGGLTPGQEKLVPPWGDSFVTMDPDGTLLLHNRPDWPEIGIGVIPVPPQHPLHEPLRRHVPALQPGARATVTRELVGAFFHRYISARVLTSEPLDPGPPGPRRPPIVASAELRPDGTLVVNLRPGTPPRDPWVRIYPPAHPRYRAVMDHIIADVGPLAPRQNRLVHSWPGPGIGTR